MVQKNLSGIISAIALILLGIFLLILSITQLKQDITGSIFLIVYGKIAIGLGIYIFFNLKKEDTIEQIKQTK